MVYYGILCMVNYETAPWCTVVYYSLYVSFQLRGPELGWTKTQKLINSPELCFVEFESSMNPWFSGWWFSDCGLTNPTGVWVLTGNASRDTSVNSIWWNVNGLGDKAVKALDIKLKGENI